MSLHLVIRERGAFLRALPLSGVVVVGRSPDSDVVVLDPKVSRQHVRIVEDGAVARITDLKSKHGTRLNGNTIAEGSARAGEVVQIGEAVEIDIAASEDDGILLRRAGAPLPETAISPHANRRLRLLYTISAALSDLRSVNGVSEKMLAAVCEAVAADYACLDVLGEGSNIRESYEYPPRVAGSRARAPLPFFATVVQGRERLIAATLLGSAMAVPLVAGGNVCAVISVERRTTEQRFSEEDLEFLTAIGAVLATALVQAEQFERVRMAAAATRAPLHQIVGSNERVVKLRSEIARVASSEANAVIYGESGTGKELVAHQIHAQSRRADGPFVAINCAAIPDGLFEAEMFGTVPGAFPEAKNRDGHFLQARSGTIFLDEVAELTLRAQCCLLRVIEARTLMRLGSSKVEKVDVRIVAASHKRLNDQVARGAFREDLCFRLNVVELEVPPLRDRKDDVAILAALFAKQVAARDGVDAPTFTPAAMSAMMSYRWPGNVRELRSEVERAMVFREGAEIDREDFSERVRGTTAAPRTAPVRGSGAGPGGRPEENARTLQERFASLERDEKDIVLQAVADANGNVTQAARILGVTRIKVARRLDKYEGNGR